MDKLWHIHTMEYYKQWDEQTIAINNNMDKLYKYDVEWKSTRARHKNTYWIFHSYKTQKQGKLIYGVKT